MYIEFKSLPMWECGLKLHVVLNPPCENVVAPHVGVWIEIDGVTLLDILALSRSPCGSVD